MHLLRLSPHVNTLELMCFALGLPLQSDNVIYFYTIVVMDRCARASQELAKATSESLVPHGRRQ